MHQDLVRPGTLVACDIVASAVTDLRGADPAVFTFEWRQIFAVEHGVPPSWALAVTGAEGALVPSIQHRGGTNLVLWRWHDALAQEGGEGTALTLLDPKAVPTGD